MYARITEPLKQQVRDKELWASHLPPELGGGGFGQVKLGLMHEILGQSPLAPRISRRVPVLLLNDRARRRGRPDAIDDPGGP